MYITVTLFLGGVFIFTRFSQANLYLAVFGHAASEEILFSWIGWTTTPLSALAVAILFPFSLLALWLAYFNVLDLKKLSLGEALFGLLFSTAFILFPRFL